MIDVFIAGAQKAGTTSILRYLTNHPRVISHEHMEMTYFYVDNEYEQGDTYFAKHYGLHDEEGKLILAKHATMSRSERALGRLAKHNPNCKIIFCTRDPVERAFSSYLMEKRNGAFDLPFDEVMEIAFREREHHWYYNVFVKLGCYQEHITRILKFFPAEQLRVIKTEELKENADSVLKALCAWLKLDFHPEINARKKYNTRNEVSIGSVKRLVNKISWVKPLVFRVLGRKRAERAAKMMVRFTRLRPQPLTESLEDYPLWKARLKSFYDNPESGR
jgi:hypothetical protein